jgi:hypothetical protein
VLAGLALVCSPAVLGAQGLPDDAVVVRAVAEPARAVPGGRCTIAVTIEFAPGFHAWPNEPVLPPPFERLRAIPTTIEFASLPEGMELEGIDWPEATPVTVRYTGRPIELMSYAGTVVAHVRLRVAADAPSGRTTVRLTVGYQTCDERLCYRPTTVERTVRLRVAS